jgi:hypothetical protein
MATIELGGKVTNDKGTDLEGLTVQLYTAIKWEAGCCQEQSDTTDSNGLWNFDGVAQDNYVVVVNNADSTKKMLFDGRNEVQFSKVDIRSLLQTDTILEATTGTGVTIDSVLLKDGGATLSGTLDVNGTIDFDGTTVAACASGAITLTSTSTSACGIYLRANGGTSETIKIHSDLGTSVTEGAESVTILSDLGGVGIRSTANLANAINITADGSTASTIQIYNDTGTAVNEGVASIQLLSDVGGIGIKSGLDAAGAIRLTADAGECETIILHSDQGTGEGSITLTSDAGGIDLNAAAGKDIALDSGQVLITATHNTACTIYLHANGGTAETIKIHSDQGTSESSITILSDAGGINIDAPAAKDIDVAGGTINLTSSDNAGSAIYLRANAGTSETIKIHADQGNGVGSICLTSDDGGITLNAATFVTVGGNTTNAGEIRIMEDGDAGAEYVAIKAQNMGASYTLTLPADDGCACEVLTTNGSGLLTWEAAAETPAASEAEIEAGCITNKYVSPGRAQKHESAAKAWVSTPANGVSCDDVYNATGAKCCTGKYIMTFANPMADSLYVVVATALTTGNDRHAVASSTSACAYRVDTALGCSATDLNNASVVFGDVS